MGALKNPKFVLPAMSHSAGTITATFQNGSSLSRLISADVTLVANTLYMVYLVASGGTAALRISTNVNSVGPSGFTTWTLVGAFYSNALVSVAFGSFVNITSVPTSGEIDMNITGSGWSFTPVAGKNKYIRDGKYMDLILRFGVASAAASLAQINLPANVTTASSYSTDSTLANPVGVLGTGFAGELAFLSAKPSSTFLTVNLFRLSLYAPGVSYNANALGNGELVAAGRVAIQEWSNTPLVDL